MSSWTMPDGPIHPSAHQRLMAAFEGRGRLLLDVPLCAGAGDWPPGTTDLRMTAVWLPHAEPQEPMLAEHDNIALLVAGEEVVLVMAEGYGDRPLVGWLLGGGDMFSRSYPDHGLLRHAVVVDGGQELNMGRVYANLGIEVVVVDG